VWKFKIIVAPETSQILFACTAVAPPAKFVLRTFAQFPASPPAPPGFRDTSPSPALPVRVSQVNTSNSSSKGHQTMLDPLLSVLPAAEPTQTQHILTLCLKTWSVCFENSLPFCNVQYFYCL
jgi:hypothetical protein